MITLCALKPVLRQSWTLLFGTFTLHLLQGVVAYELGHFLVPSKNAAP